MSEPIVDLLLAEWAILLELGSTLAEGDWDIPTDLPGWSVRDNLSHLIGIERTLLGDPAPEGYGEAATAPHVKNPIGEMNEKWVASYRDKPGRAVLAEFAAVVDRRQDALAAMSTEEFDKKGWTPIGEAPYREFMGIRLMDTWAHEQDIRRATGRSGNLDGPVAEKCLERVESALPFIVGKKAAAPEGSLIAFHLTGPIAKTVAIVVENGRARTVGALFPGDEPREDGASVDLDQATTEVSLSSEAFCCLGFGRWDPAAALEKGMVTVSGDTTLGRRIITAMPFMI